MTTNFSSTLDAQIHYSYRDLKTQLLSQPCPVLPPSPSSPSQKITHAISSLFLHPSLESALHILNNDLPSAHFLLRHMQAPPAYESMFLHGILHRIEGDYDNARAWYKDAQSSEVFKLAWPKGGLEDAMKFLKEIEILRKKVKPQDRGKEETKLKAESTREITSVIEYCEKKFGTEKLEDASKFWVQDEDSKRNGSDMIVGGEGWRTF